MEKMFLDFDGKRFEIFYDGDQKSKKLALFLHGFPQTAHVWRHQIPALSQEGYKCWAPNLRGYGGSYSPKDVQDYNMNLIGQDVINIINASDCDKVVLIGHDWGGAVGWWVAKHHPEVLHHLVIMNSPHPAIFAREANQWRQLKRSWYMLAFQLPWLPEWYLTRHEASKVRGMIRKGSAIRSVFSKADFDVYQQNALRPGGMKAMLNWYRAALKSRKSAKHQTGGPISVPTLMIWGEKDPALGIHTILGTEKYVKSLTLRFIPEAGHFLPEEASENVNQMMIAYLKGEKVPGSKDPQTSTE